MAPKPMARNVETQWLGHSANCALKLSTSRIKYSFTVQAIQNYFMDSI